MNKPIIAVGGVGGSGTRIFSQIFQDLGLNFGGYQNPSLDTQAFMLIFKRLSALTFSDQEFLARANLLQASICDERLTEIQKNLLKIFAQDDETERPGQADNLMAALTDMLHHQRKPNPSQWGWKEPNTHMIVDRFLELWSNFKFICVVRDGKDMAFSGNQNQIKIWGQGKYEMNPDGSFAFWCDTHRRMIDLAKCYPNRIALVSYEAFCDNPRPILASLCKFAQIEVTSDQIESLSAQVRPAKTIGRAESKKHDFKDIYIDLYNEIYEFMASQNIEVQ